MWIVGFGTLLYQNSLKHTIGETDDAIEYIPIVINDYKRLFNVYAGHYKASSALTSNGIEMGAANIKHVPSYQCNAVAFEASEDEVALLDKRERYYERIKVEVYNYHTNEVLEDAYAYCAKDHFSCIRHSIDELLPNWRDIDYARKGAYAISEKFGQLYDATTYLADEETLMVDHYKNVL